MAAIERRTIYLIGDSLTRQWSKVMQCELEHVLGLSPQEAASKVRWTRCNSDLRRQKSQIKKFLRDATANDVVVFNFGHHVGMNAGEDWKAKYADIIEYSRTFDFGPMPRSNVFFRTTSVRHFLAGYGDWNTDFTAGNTAPDMQAEWQTYGGNQPELPDQNLIALSTLLSDRGGNDGPDGNGDEGNGSFQILDTSPMMLARGDATYDGSHFCLPGPTEFWSRMLYLRLERQGGIA